MSTCRYDWWGYAKSMVRRYPELLRQYRDLHDTPLTARLDGTPGGSGRVSRPVENAALRMLPPAKMRELNAVHKALCETRETLHGEQKLEMIRLVYWRRSHNLVGAAIRLEISEVTAKRWNGEFLRRVGRAFGLLDEDWPEQHAG